MKQTVNPLISEWAGFTPLVGMVHLRPLPGSPRYTGEWEAVRTAAVEDARALEAGGAHGIMMENFGDAPFYPNRVPAETVAAITSVAEEVRRRTSLPLGINVLRNDGESALAVAKAVGARFVRINVLTGARLADQGILEGAAHLVLRTRARLYADDIRILADVAVKHSAPLGPRSLEDEVGDMCRRGGADAVLVTGGATGDPANLEEMRRVKQAAGETPVWVASGVTPETIPHLKEHADGLIVGTWVKQEGRLDLPVDAARVKRLITALA